MDGKTEVKLGYFSSHGTSIELSSNLGVCSQSTADSQHEIKCAKDIYIYQ
jgi:hypothetical protein